MKIKMDGHFVCSVCWADWHTYRGASGREGPQCENCGARADDGRGVDSEGNPLLEVEDDDLKFYSDKKP